jgi:putative ABC transport system permease protein
VINRLPIDEFDLNIRVRAEGAPPAAVEALPQVGLVTIGGRYLDTMRVPVVRGRGIDAAEISDGRPVALLSEAAARVLWPGDDPLGKRATLLVGDEPERAVVVVGIVADVRATDVFKRTTPQVFVPSALHPERAMAIAVRSLTSDPHQLAPALRAAVAAFEPNEPLFSILSMEEVLYNDEASGYVLAALLIVIAGVALCLAAAGIYGVVSYQVVQRTREIGVRVALGANPAWVSRMIVAQGARPALSGGLLGLPAAVGLAFILASAVTPLQARDVRMYVFVMSAIALVALLATYVPARRASRADPVIALRAD